MSRERCNECGERPALDQYDVCLECWRAWRSKEYVSSDGLADCEGRKRSPVPMSHPSRHRPPKGMLVREEV